MLTEKLTLAWTSARLLYPYSRFEPFGPAPSLRSALNKGGLDEAIFVLVSRLWVSALLLEFLGAVRILRAQALDLRRLLLLGRVAEETKDPKEVADWVAGQYRRRGEDTGPWNFHVLLSVWVSYSPGFPFLVLCSQKRLFSRVYDELIRRGLLRCQAYALWLAPIFGSLRKRSGSLRLRLRLNLSIRCGLLWWCWAQLQLNQKPLPADGWKRPIRLQEGKSIGKRMVSLSDFNLRQQVWGNQEEPCIRC